jgi:hypothetical protein
VVTDSSNHHRIDPPKRSIDAGGLGSTIRAVPSDASRHQVSNNGFDNSIGSHEASPSHGNHDLKKSGHPVRGSAGNDALAVKPVPGLAITKDDQGTHVSHGWKEKQRAMLEGVVDLNNTVDTERDITYAPGKHFPTQWLQHG